MPQNQSFSAYKARQAWPQHIMQHFENLSLIQALEPVSGKLALLPPFLRTLLVADGTVTRSLEAYFWEPIDVRQVEQKIVECADNVDALELTLNEQILLREVELRGRETGKLYSKAKSIIKINDIPLAWRNELTAGKLGIGTLISDSGMESYREITEYRLSTSETDEAIRTYRILLNGQPTILITESFPVSAYKQ